MWSTDSHGARDLPRCLDISQRCSATNPALPRSASYIGRSAFSIAFLVSIVYPLPARRMPVGLRPVLNRLTLGWDNQHFRQQPLKLARLTYLRTVLALAQRTSLQTGHVIS